MTTVLLSPRGSQDSDEVWRAAVRRGWDTHRAVRYVPPDPLPDSRFAYGEVSFCDIMADRAGLGLLDPPDDWLASLPYDLLKRKVRFTRAHVLSAFRQRSFFKPSNDKVFSAGIYERGADVPTRWVDPNCPCYVSEVVAFDVEFRFHVLDKRVMSGTFYRLIAADELEMKAEATDFVTRVLESHGDGLPSSVVLDVGRIEGRGWAVVEANQSHASGIYEGSDVNGVLDCCLRSAGPMASVSDQDRRFLRNP